MAKIVVQALINFIRTCMKIFDHFIFFNFVHFSPYKLSWNVRTLRMTLAVFLIYINNNLSLVQIHYIPANTLYSYKYYDVTLVTGETFVGRSSQWEIFRWRGNPMSTCDDISKWYWYSNLTSCKTWNYY